MYILRPHAAGILYAPPFYTPPTPRRVFSGVGGWGCIKIGPVFCEILMSSSKPRPPRGGGAGQTSETCRKTLYPEGPARHLDASRQKLTSHCLAAIFDSQLPSPKLSLKMPPKLPLPHKRGLFSSKIVPAVRVIARQLCGKNCLAAIFASRHQDVSPGPLGNSRKRFLGDGVVPNPNL